jgi:hypothetical protein
VPLRKVRAASVSSRYSVKAARSRDPLFGFNAQDSQVEIFAGHRNSVRLFLP